MVLVTEPRFWHHARKRLTPSYAIHPEPFLPMELVNAKRNWWLLGDGELPSP